MRTGLVAGASADDDEDEDADDDADADGVATAAGAGALNKSGGPLLPASLANKSPSCSGITH
jgi:hypothetical protein